MLPIADSFEYNHNGSDILYGRGCVKKLEGFLEDNGLSRALLVCGSNVGANEALMSRVTGGLGGRLEMVFDETTPDKRVETVFDGVEVLTDVDADVVVGLGGGSSIDIARQISIFSQDNRPLSAYQEAAQSGESLYPDPTGELPPVIVIPTTFAGADISSGGSPVVLDADASPTNQPITTGGRNTPRAMVYDPELFETTPDGALAGSAMNGFNKSIETIYSRNDDPITDGTASLGMRHLRDGYQHLDEPAGMDRAVVGIILAQFNRRISVIHAFGHGFSRRYPVQQGKIHGIVVPHVLEYVFEKIDGRRDLIATGLDVDHAALSDEEVAESIIQEVEAIRDCFDLPTQLREMDPVDPDDFPDIAEFILDDDLMELRPVGLDPTPSEIEVVLENAW